MIQRWSEGSADDVMSEDLLVYLTPVIRNHPWWQARSALLLDLLRERGITRGASVLDAGCGWGVTLDALEHSGYRADGLDISRRSLERIDSPRRHLIEADLERPVPSGATSYDAVVALDVIEHIDNDRDALANLCSLTRPNGIAIVSVPALPELFSEFDQIQGHRRRYVPETLQQAFAGSGFQIDEVLWWGGWLVPLFRLQRARRRGHAEMTALQIYAEYVKLPPPPLAALFRLAFRVEHRRALKRRIRRGTSLIAIAHRVQ